MNNIEEITDGEVLERYHKLKDEAYAGGYFLNPDREFTLQLIRGILINEKRYGYGACPCRLASGKRTEDLDIICPCDYRDSDIEEYGACYCSLYVSKEVADGFKKPESIPDRRPVHPEVEKQGNKSGPTKSSKLTYPVWRCRVCGYLAARENPPGICPVCKASKDRFEKFM
ncbi:ferredoxin:glutaredoxin reductase [bacterium]|nr:ferredoxin:glutaredoxin reductase [bacterium]